MSRCRIFPGVCGIVDGSVMAGYYGIEAGQSAVGDIFLWFVNTLVPAKYGRTQDEQFANLEKAAAALEPGESGLLALDWNNGNRTILVDVRLSGLLIGQTLHTQPHEIYRALLEATGFGALVIIDRIEEYGVPIKMWSTAAAWPAKMPADDADLRRHHRPSHEDLAQRTDAGPGGRRFCGRRCGRGSGRIRLGCGRAEGHGRNRQGIPARREHHRDLSKAVRALPPVA